MGAKCNNERNGIGLFILNLSDVNGFLTIDVTGTTVTIDIVIPNGGQYIYNLWLSESATDPSESLNHPQPADVVRWEGVTDLNGEATIIFQNTGAPHTWYPWATFLRANIGDAITAGV